MRPYGASLLSLQKESKPCVPASGPALRSGSLRSGIAPVGTAPKGRPGPTVLAGHPWPAPDYAIPTLSLLKGRSRVSGLAMYEEPDQKQKLHTSTSLLPLPLPLLCFYLHKSCRRQIVPSVGRMEPLRSGATAMDGRRAPQGQDGPSARSPREQGWNEGARSAAQGRMQGQGVLPTFAPTKVGRRKGETSQWCHCIKWICPSTLEPHLVITRGAH